MDSRCNKSCTEDNASKVFELIITNPSSEPSKPVDISCVSPYLTAKTNALVNVVSKDGFKDSEAIVIDDLDNEVTTTDENSSKDDTQNNIKANTETSNNVKESVVKISSDCNDNQKESTESVVILDETNTDDLNQTNLTSGQLTKTVVQNDNLTTHSDLDLYEIELQNALNGNKTNSRIRVTDKPPPNAVDIDTGKCKRTEKAVCSDNIAKKDDPTIDSDIDFYETESQNVATLSGNREDSDVLVLDSKTSSDNTIIQDDNEVTILGKEYPPIDLVDEDEDPFSHNVISEDYTDEFKKNSLLAELVQKCLKMESNGGMQRVINRTLLNIYRSVDERYKKSVVLRKVLTTTIMKLHMEPELKFSHIKFLCDHLKSHIVKKRVTLVTLEKRSTGDKATSTIPSKKRRVETIDLDNYAVKNQNTTAPKKNKEYPPIEIDDSSSSIEEVNDIIIVDNKKAKKTKVKRKKKKKQKGGLARSFIPTLVRNPFCTISDPSLKEIPTSNQTERIPVKPNQPVSTHEEPQQISKLQTESTIPQIIDSSRDKPQINSQSLLTPIVVEPVSLNSGNSDQLHEARKTSEIEKIEKHIAFLREEIEKLEEMEVQVDDETSPYIVSEQYQSMLVKQYKRLCELTGTQEKKHHKVRLQVLPGHPEAPVRYLQEFLNNNIDDEGNPPFPDFYDVIQCVSNANVECNMNWGQAQIMKEARSLFIQFGQTMQKRRQKREWKDLMSRVKEEVIDPAEQDVELMMKLNRNSWIAKQKENALIDRYASLEQSGLSARIANDLSVTIENGATDPETESSDDENANPRVPYSSSTYERQNDVGNSVSVTNGSIGIPTTNEKQNGNIGISATYEKQNGSIGIPATYEKQNGSLGTQTSYEKQNGSLGIPTTYEKQKIVGSTITLSNGYIEIAPTYDVQKSSIVIPNRILGITTTPFQLNSNVFGVPSTQNATNTLVLNDIQNVTSPENRVMQNKDDTSMYALEFQKFTSKLAAASNAGKCNLCTIVQSNFCSHNNNVSTDNNRNVGTVKGHVSTPVNNQNVGTVNSNVSAINNNVYLVNNSNVNTVNNGNINTVNKSIIGTVNSEKAQSKIDLENATNLAKTIMELVQKDVSHRTTYGNKNSKEVANSHDLTPKITDAKIKEETDEKMDESVCDIFTHKTKPANKNAESKATPKCTETKTDKTNVPNQADVETSSGIETKDVLEDIVKSEPLDISRMLAELGDEYTAVVFDIEDPFLVIEISDSSESEDEVT